MLPTLTIAAPDLRRLNHLLVLAEEQHFARAASRVRLSQPAFSRSIQALEEEVGIRLFDRKKGDVHVTPAGEYMIERARKLLFEARSLQRDMDLYRGSDVGDLAIGVGPIVAVELMPRILAELRSAHPHVAMQVEQTSTKQLMDRLFAESLEFIVADARDVPDDNQTDVKVLPGQPVQCFAHARHPLAGKSSTLAEAWEFGVSSVRISDTTRACSH
jgi:DNA-binding transcriptional LysR family regulator